MFAIKGNCEKRFGAVYLSVYFRAVISLLPQVVLISSIKPISSSIFSMKMR